MLDAKEMIAERYEYIENEVFKDIGALGRNLKVMKYNTDHDWYNCSIISQYESRDESEVRVYSIYKWEMIFEETLDIVVPRTGKRVFLLKPIYDEETNYLDFELEEYYYLSSLSRNNKKIYFCKSKVEIAMEDYAFKKKSGILKKDWQEKLLIDYLNKYLFYTKANSQMQRFYKNIMLYTFGSNLLVETKKVSLMLPESVKNKVEVYRNMHRLITSFHIAFKTFLSKLDDDHRELKEKGLIEDRPFRAGYERLRQLERGM